MNSRWIFTTDDQEGLLLLPETENKIKVTDPLGEEQEVDDTAEDTPV